MLGFGGSKDAWLGEYEEAKTAADHVMELIHERSQVKETEGADAARLTGTVRRKLSGLKAKLERLEGLLRGHNVTDSEAARRHDMVTRLRTRCDQMGSLLNRPAERNSLLAGLAAGAPAVETEQTAELDNRGLILMQRELMRDQDDQLEDLSTLVSSTKHISLAIGEEVGLQNRLLEDLEHDMETSEWRIKTATKRALDLLKKSSNFTFMVTIFILFVILVLLLVVALKLG